MEDLKEWTKSDMAHLYLEQALIIVPDEFYASQYQQQGYSSSSDEGVHQLSSIFIGTLFQQLNFLLKFSFLIGPTLPISLGSTLSLMRKNFIKQLL